MRLKNEKSAYKPEIYINIVIYHSMPATVECHMEAVTGADA